MLLGAGRMGRAYVDYGLGNFVFYVSGTGPKTMSGVLTLTMQGRQVSDAAWTPARITGGVPIVQSGPAAEQARARWQQLRGCTGLA